METKETIPLAIFLIVALAGMYIISTQAKPQNIYVSPQPQEHSVIVSGEAKTKVAPNLAQISFTIETNDSLSAKTAQEKNADATARVKTALVAAGMAEKDISTTQFSVLPITVSKWKCPIGDDKKCDYSERTYYQEVSGYKASHGILIRSEDTKKAGAVLDAISRGAGNEVKVTSVSFTLRDETRKSVERDLLEKAAQDAREKAQKISSGAGFSLGKVTGISENVVYPYNYRYDGGYELTKAVGAAPPVADTAIFPSEIDVSARVSVNFAIN